MSYSLALPEELKKEFKVDADGKTSSSISGLARMFLVSQPRLSRHFSDALEPSNLAKTLMEQGFDADALQSWADTGVPDTAIPTIAQYYAFDAKQVSEESRNAARNFIRVTSAIGVRTWFQQELGYNQNNGTLALTTQLTQIIQSQAAIMAQIDKQNEKLDEISTENENLLIENVELTDYKEQVETYPEFAYLLDVAKSEIEPHEYMVGITCKEYILQNNIPLKEEAWCTLSRRTASYYRSTKGADPKRRGNHTIYYNKDVAYIVATLRLIMKGL